MGENKSRYGIKVQFSCKLCTVRYFETVEEYIEHKKENHFTQFHRTKGLIILEEKTLSVDSYYHDENETEVDLDLDVDVKVDIDYLSRSFTSTTLLNEKRTDSDEEKLMETNDPLSTSTKTCPQHSTLPENENETKPLIEYGILSHKSINPVVNKSTENERHSRTIPGNFSDDRNSPEPSFLYPKSELVVFEAHIPQEEDEENLDTETENVQEIGHDQNSFNASSAVLSYNVIANNPNFVCELCMTKFSSKSNLKIHGHMCVLYHPNRNSYCAQCNKLFSSASMLNRHRVICHSKTTSASESVQTENALSYYSELLDNLGEPRETDFILSDGIDDLSQATLASFSPKKPKSNISMNTGCEIGGTLYPKPLFSFPSLIGLALKNSQNACLPVTEIYKFISYHFPYFESAKTPWKNSIRQRLSYNTCFRKIEEQTGVSGAPVPGRACTWAVHPPSIPIMDQEIQQQLSANPRSIRSSMRDPENVELLLKGELKGAHDWEKYKDSTFTNLSFSF